MKKYITPTVIIVSLVSFFTDIASEMLYPIMPGYLQSIGYGVVAIGLLEGVAEAFAGISKVFFAHVSDVTGKRKIFLLFGYGISALAKPLIGFTSSIATIFSVFALLSIPPLNIVTENLTDNPT
jgi:sugar phosphate permease